MGELDPLGGFGTDGSDSGSGGRRRPRLKPVSAAAVALETIREAIHAGELAPGDRIILENLAKELSISRTPVRDALQQLQTEGLVEVVPRVGVFVREINAKEAAEVYAIKASIEPLAVRWAVVNASDGQIAALENLTAAMEEANRRGNHIRFAALIERFHLDVIEMSGSQVLSEVFGVIEGRVKLLRIKNVGRKGRMKESLAQHRDIVDALRRRDADEAHRVMQDHVEDAWRSLQRVL